MTAPPRPLYRETARETARTAGADFTGELFLAELANVARVRHPGQQDPTGIPQAWRRCQELQDEAERDSRVKLAQREADEPMRRQAERAYERAMRQRGHRVGQVAATMDWTTPRKPVIW